jgi:MerR family copper efflux transcriptional regulator
MADPELSPPIACSLDADELDPRLDEWRALLAQAEITNLEPAGARLRFERDADVTTIASLLDAEQRCCRFLTFTLTVTDHSVVVDIAAPPEARDAVSGLLAAAR